MSPRRVPGRSPGLLEDTISVLLNLISIQYHLLPSFNRLASEWIDEVFVEIQCAIGALHE